MKFGFYLSGFVGCLFLTIVLVGCKKEEFTVQSDEIEDLLAGQTDFESFDVYFRSDTIDQYLDQRGDENWLCNTITVDASISPGIFSIYNPNPEVIWPGALIQGRSISQATPELAVLPRGGGKISISTANGSEIAQASVEEVSVSNISQAINDILGGNSGIVPANFSIELQRVKTKEELDLHFKAKVKLGPIRGGAQFDFNGEDEYNRVLVILNQSYYSMVYERPNTIPEFFSSSITQERISAVTGPDNPLTYISSVNYGRKYVLLLESKISQDSLFASANASFLGNSASASVTHLDRLEDLQIHAFALGGEAGDAIRAVTNSLDETREFLASSGDIRSGMPLSYVLRSVGTNQVVKMNLATQYTYADCVPISTSVEPSIWYVAHPSNCEFVADGDIRINQLNDSSPNRRNAVYEGGFTGFRKHPALRRDNEIDNDVLWFFSDWGLGFPSVSFFNLWGGQQNETGYSFSTVLNWEEAQPGCRNAFFGKYHNEMPLEVSEGFNIGFKGQDTLFIHHSGDYYDFKIPSGLSDGYRVFTINYFTSGELQVFINGDLIGDVQGVYEPQVLSNGFFGLSKLGCKGVLSVPEFMVFDKPLTSFEQTAIEESFFQKYRL